MSPTAPRAPKRIVSLVPSDTFTLVRLGAKERIVGRTRFCVEPAADVASIPDVGGTKNPDIGKVLELAPDLVVMNREENTLSDFEKLREAGVAIVESLPKTMTEGLAQVARLARALGDIGEAAKDRVREAYAVTRRAEEIARAPAVVRVFVAVWSDPWMTVNDETFVASVLRHAGAENVFADRVRRFPLAADIGRAKEVSRERAEGRDQRYPRVTLDEIRERSPELVLLPDEPFAFGPDDANAMRDALHPRVAAENVRLVAGKHLMWPGLMSIEAFEHVRALVLEGARVASARSPR